MAVVCLHGVYMATLPSPPPPDVGNTVAQLVEAPRYEPVAGSIRGGVRFFIDLILPAAKWRWVRLSPCTGLKTLSPSCADCP